MTSVQGRKAKSSTAGPAQPSARARVYPRSEGSRKPGTPGGRSAGLPACAKARPAKPANARGAKNLLSRIQLAEIVRLRAAGESLKVLAGRFGISVSGIAAAYRRASSGAPKLSRWGRRQSSCSYCDASIPVSGSATRGVCQSCAEKACPPIWKAGDPIEALPANLRRYLQG
jgi:hypothetical protein